MKYIIACCILIIICITLLIYIFKRKKNGGGDQYDQYDQYDQLDDCIITSVPDKKIYIPGWKILPDTGDCIKSKLTNQTVCCSPSEKYYNEDVCRAPFSNIKNIADIEKFLSTCDDTGDPFDKLLDCGDSRPGKALNEDGPQDGYGYCIVKYNDSCQEYEVPIIYNNEQFCRRDYQFPP